MALVIKTTGLEQYAPGGAARLKLLIIGGPGSGKTRFASYFPRPIYADCEAGLASVADRRVPYVAISNSGEMLDLLTHLKFECRLPQDKRSYDTIVVDTLDAYQRKLKNEWMEKEHSEAFTGWEAWGFLNQKLNLLLTRLLNLDMNVVVNVHYKDKVTKDDDTNRVSHELMLQLQGETADTAFNDFDLVGWMGTYWEAEAGERIQKRGLTFKPTPDKPFLKDRLHVTPPWLPVTFEPSDYEQLFTRLSQRADLLEPSQTVGEIPTADPAVEVPVLAPGKAFSGALPATAKSPDVPLTQLDKPTLARTCRELGITTIPDGTPIRGNTLKAELIAAIQHHLDTLAAAAVPDTQVSTDIKVKVNTPDGNVPRQAAPPVVEQVAEGNVNTSTGELLDQDPPTIEQAQDVVATTLGGQVIAESPKPESAAQQAVARQVAAQQQRTQAPVTGAVCEVCGGDLAQENQDYVKLAWIKYRQRLCAADYQKRKSS